MSEGDVTKFAEAFNRSQEAKENGIRRLTAENEALRAKCAAMDNALEHCERAIVWLKDHREPDGGQPDRALKLSEKARHGTPGQALLDHIKALERIPEAILECGGGAAKRNPKALTAPNLMQWKAIVELALAACETKERL